MISDSALPLVNEKTGNTPLHVMASAPRRIAHLADYMKSASTLNPVNLHGQTPLHLAALHGNFEAAQLLLSQGAAVDILCDNWHTPLLSSLCCLEGQQVSFLPESPCEKRFLYSDISREHPYWKTWDVLRKWAPNTPLDEMIFPVIEKSRESALVWLLENGVSPEAGLDNGPLTPLRFMGDRWCYSLSSLELNASDLMRHNLEWRMVVDLLAAGASFPEDVLPSRLRPLLEACAVELRTGKTLTRDNMAPSPRPRL